MKLFFLLLAIAAIVAAFTKLRPGPAGPFFAAWGIGRGVVGAAWPYVFETAAVDDIHLVVVAMNLVQVVLTVLLAIGLALIPATLKRQRQGSWHSSP